MLDPKLKEWIDNATYETLLRTWRFAPVGDPVLQGETGDYYQARMQELRAKPGGDEEHVRASKAIGWTR